MNTREKQRVNAFPEMGHIRNRVLEEQMMWWSRNTWEQVQDESQKGSRATKTEKNQLLSSKELSFSLSK